MGAELVSPGRSRPSGGADEGEAGAETTGETAGAGSEAATVVADAGGAADVRGARVSAEGAALECMTPRARATAAPATITNNPPSRAAEGRRERTAGTGVVDRAETVTAFATGSRATAGGF